MTTVQILELAVKYGLNNVLMVYLLIQFIKTTKELAKTIHHNTVALTKVSVVIEKCKKSNATGEK
jgi:hypothetical protein